MANKRPHSSEGQEAHDPTGIVPSHGISIDVSPTLTSQRPPLLHHVSTPAYESPLRHHTRTHSSHREVKETLNARSEYTNSEDDGAAQHRLNQYIIKQEIGRGSFGAVHLAVDQYGTEYAVKEFSKSRLRKRAQSHVLRGPHAGRRRGHLAAGMSFNSPLHQHSTDSQDGKESNSLYLIKEEIAIMKKLNHPNLVSLIEVLDDPDEDSLYMVMEMCKKGVVMKVGLDERSDPYDNKCCRTWFRDLILGIEYLHAQGILHRDIKPDNCLLTDDDVLKIVDFGVSEMFEKDQEMLTAKSAGSPAFLPPELCVAKHGGISGKAADIWSMGVTLYCLRYGKIPFEKTGIFELYESIRIDPVDCGAEEDDDFRDLMTRLLEKDPTKRIELAEIREHPWVTKRGRDPLLSVEENTADLVEPPTEEEMNHAITGNMSNLLVVMKAATKFKKLIARRRPGIMESILGGSEPPHLVAPPLSMGNHPHLAHKSKSVETYDRRPVERILVSEGAHHELDVNNLNKRYSSPKMDPALHVSTKPLNSRSKEKSFGSPKEGQEEPPSRDVTASPDSILPLSHNTTLHSPHSWEQEGNRGHAHNPLEEQLYLRIGASSMAGPSNQEDDEDFSDDQNMVVSESPGAAEGNIYETAYREEIERIRSKSGHDTKVYLTRRVEGKEAVKDMGKLVGGLLAGKTAQTGKGESGESENSGMDKRLPAKGFSNLVDKVTASGKAETDHVASKEKYEEYQSETQKELQEMDEEASVPQDGNKTPEVLPEPTSAPAESIPQSSMSKMRKFSRGGFKGLLGKMKGSAR